MKIIDALPRKKYLDALKHSKTPGWSRKKKAAIAYCQEWAASPEINKSQLPELLFGYGKDSSALFLLLKMAGVKFRPITVLNGGDMPQHELVFPEFDKFIDMSQYPHVIHRTEYRYVEHLAALVQWGRDNGMTHKGKPISYWNMGPLLDELYWVTADSFMGEASGFEDDVLMFSGKRTSEAMDRFYEVDRNGPFFRDGDEKGRYAFTWFNGYPIHDWKDIDVWALLVSEDVPISPVYSFHEIPQKLGKQRFPRTYWYPEPPLMNGTYYKWLARYCPAQVRELDELFPEIRERLTQGKEE